MSWLILSPNGTWRKRYLLRCVLNIVSSDALSVRCIPKNALLLSTFENLVALVSMCAISSRVSALWCSRMITLFRSFGSRQILNLPLGFFGYINELTHGVSSIWFAIIPWWTISFSSFLISTLCSIGTLCLLCCTGGMLGSVLMSYSPWHVTYSIERVRIQGLQVPGTMNVNATWLHIDWVEPRRL